MSTIIFEPRVTLLARQEFIYPEHIDWRSDSEVPAEVLTEFGGRLCYLSFGKGELDGHKTIGGRPRNADYLENILKVAHGSVVEHAGWSILIEGVSRSLTHELVRHRAGVSLSQLSQRYVDESQVAFVLPPEIKPGSRAYYLFEESCEAALDSYRDLLRVLTEQLTGSEEKQTMLRKRARQAARSVLPNAAETKLVLTGNARSFRHILEMRGAEGADMEIRRFAVKLARLLKDEAPNLFPDVEIVPHTDGTELVTFQYSKV